MPLSRYQIRNEFTLADPDLYKTADKDEPEALLEGVSMAGLVGLLRQLGDLAQFAAELFHDLHEEVMTTVARGQSLMVRVQQLELEFPLIEKAFLLQTNNSAFFYNPGVDWHPKMHIDHNHITRGDLPPFLMDSYEETRGPPRLLLLDKFDVAGAGACLKRYTDPSFFKVEAAALRTTNADVQLEKKVRKGKRRGSRWRNGETPEVLPTPHAKLHQLLLEERIENIAYYPARRVKLKRMLNGFPFDFKTGKSYMEKILETDSPDRKVLQEVPVYSSPLRLPAKDFDLEVKRHDFGSENPGIDLTPRSPSPTLDVKDDVLNVSRDELNFVTSIPKSNDVPKPDHSFEADNDSSTLHEDAGKEEILVDRESKADCSMDGYLSDDVASEVENYMDALATMESEMDTDSELRAKSDLDVLCNRRQEPDSDATKSLCEAHFSDSQSMGSSTLSDDGNCSSKICISSSSYSDSPSILAEDTYLEGEISNEVYPSNEYFETKSCFNPLKWRGCANNAGVSEVAGIPAYSSDHCDQALSNNTVSPVGELGVLPVKTGEILYAQDVLKTESTNATESGTNLDINMPFDPDASTAPLQREYNPSFGVVTENLSLDSVDDEHLSMEAASFCVPNLSNDACFNGGSKDQHMEHLVDDNLNLLQYVAPAFCLLDHSFLNTEENLSPSSLKSQPQNPNVADHPLKHPPEDLSVSGLGKDFPMDISAAGNAGINVMDGSSVNLTSRTDVTPENGETLLNNMAETGDEEDHFEVHPVVNVVLSPITIGPLAEEQGLMLRLPELETNAREAEAEYSDDQLDNAVSPSAGVVIGPITGMGISGDDHSEDLHISRVTDVIQPLEPVETDHFINCSFPVISKEKSFDLSSAATEAQALSGSSKSGDIKEIQAPVVLYDFPQVDAAMVGNSYNGDKKAHELPRLADLEKMDAAPARETALDIARHLSGSLKGHDFKGMRTSVTVDDIAQLDVAEVGISYYEDEKIQELPSLEGREDMDAAPARETALEMKPLTGNPKVRDSKETQASVTVDDIEQLNAVDVGTSSNWKEKFHKLRSLEGEETDGVTPSTHLAGRGDDDSESFTGCINLSEADAEGDGIESRPYVIDAEVVVSVNSCVLVMSKKESEQIVASQYLDSVYHTESEVLDNFSDTLTESKSSLHSEIAASFSMEQSAIDMNKVHSEKNVRTDYAEDTLQSPIHLNEDKEKAKLPVHQLDEEETEVFRKKYEDNIVPEPQLKPEGNPDRLDQEEYPGIASISIFGNLPSQQSASELLLDEKAIINDVFQPNEPLGTIFPSFGLLPEAVNIDLEGMPPLPPLPPVQWRTMGKNQPASLAHEKEAAPNMGLLPLLSLSMADQKAQTLELSLPHHTDPAENSPLVYQSASGNIVHYGPFSAQVPHIVNDRSDTKIPLVWETHSVNQNLPLAGSNSILPSHGEKKFVNCLLPLDKSNSNSPSLCEPHSGDQVLPRPGNKSSHGVIQCMHPNLPLPAKLDEMVQHDDLKGPSVNSFSQGTGVDTAAAGDDGRVHVSANLIQQHEAPETNPKGKLLNQGFACSEGNLTIHDDNALPPKKENEQPQDLMPSMEREIVWPAQDEGKENGVRIMKLPRPRNPLIDAVVAHDKSKMRKVTERPRPQIQKPDERDSLLEQIRAKSFNLKPTVVSKPSIQGPSTNLKVAAILEKAKTIRQAFAGSEEDVDDDDDDSWSDS